MLETYVCVDAGRLSRRALHNVSVSTLESLREWARQNQTPAGVYAKMLDLRHEPMYRAAEMSRRALREEIIGRLVLVRERHKTAGRLVSGSDSIDAAVSRLAEESLPLSWMLPGPLDGHHRPAETGTRRLPEDDIERAAEELVSNPTIVCFIHFLPIFHSTSISVKHS